MNNKETTIRYYAAFKISRIKNKNISREAVPVLKEILESEEDPDLQDRAKIAYHPAPLFMDKVYFS